LCVIARTPVLVSFGALGRVCGFRPLPNRNEHEQLPPPFLPPPPSPSAVCFFTPLSPHCPVARFNFTLLRQSIRRPGPCIAIVVEDASSFASRRSSFATSLPRRARLILTIGWSPGKRSTQKSTENNPFRTVLDRCALFFTTSHSIFLPSSSQSPVAFLHLPLFSPTGRLY